MAHGFYSSGWQRSPDIRGGALALMPSDGGNDPAKVSTTRPANIIPTMGWRGMRIRALGDTDTDILDMVIFSVEVDNDQQPTAYTTTELGTLIWVTGPLANPIHAHWNPLGGTEFFADQITSWTPLLYANALFSYANGSVILADTDDSLISEMFLPDLGNIYGIVLAFEQGNDGGTAGAMYKLDV